MTVGASYYATLEQHGQHLTLHFSLQLCVLFPEIRVGPGSLYTCHTICIKTFVDVVVKKERIATGARAKVVRHHLRKGAVEIKISGPVRTVLGDVFKDHLKAQVVRRIHCNRKTCLVLSLLALHSLATRVNNNVDPLLDLLNGREIRVFENCFEGIKGGQELHSCDCTNARRGGLKSGGHDCR